MFSSAVASALQGGRSTLASCRLACVGGGNRMHRSELPDDPFPDARGVPVLVERVIPLVGELDEDVIRSHWDAAAAAWAAI